MNRQLTCDLKPDDTSFLLADELVHYGFINAVSDHQGEWVHIAISAFFSTAVMSVIGSF